MRNINSVVSVSFFTVLVILSGCEKFVEIDSPKNQLLDDAVFSDSANAGSAITGLYINALQNIGIGFSSGAITVYSGLSGDELIPVSLSNVNMIEFYTNSLSAGNFTNSSMWIKAYNLIYSANACIEGLEHAVNISEQTRNQLIGEARLFRCFMYFNLINLYGAVPLVSTTQYSVNQKMERNSTDEIFSFLISELSEAKQQLQLDYITSARSRPNKHTASFLLSKVFLYKNDWASAEQEASEIIASGIYQLETDLNNVFLSTSNEAIWKLVPVVPGYETWEGYTFIPGSSTSAPAYTLSPNLLQDFETGDQRLVKWTNKRFVSGTEVFFPFKYKLGYDGSTIPKEHYVIFRFAEALLIRAESRANLNKLTEAAADLNQVRSRAGLSPVSYFHQQELLALIQKERRIEMFAEWGNRWFDLKRTNSVDSILSGTKPNWDTHDALYPVPLTEINTNPFLTQNPGY